MDIQQHYTITATSFQEGIGKRGKIPKKYAVALAFWGITQYNKLSDFILLNVRVSCVFKIIGSAGL